MRNSLTIVFLLAIGLNTTVLIGQKCNAAKFPCETFLQCDWCDRDAAGRTYSENFPFDKWKITPWQLVYEDNFDGNDLNTDYWYTHFGYGRQISVPNDDFTYLDRNISVDNGTLKLTVRHEPGTYDQWQFEENGQLVLVDKFYHYTSGAISSKIGYKEGKFEVRCKFPSNTNDLNPAFWLLGDCGQEIDVFELLRDDEPQTISMSYHGKEGGEHGDISNNQEVCKSSEICKNTADLKDSGYNDGDWHVYAVHWTLHSITWSIDGHVKLCVPRLYTVNGDPVPEVNLPGNYIRDGAFPYLNNPMRIIINLGNREGDPWNNGTSPDIPRVMEVDWVRVYKQQRCNLDYEVCTGNGLWDSNIDSYKLADKILISSDESDWEEKCHFVLEPGESGSFFYSDYTDVGTKVTIKRGSFFEVVPMTCHIEKKKSIHNSLFDSDLEMEGEFVSEDIADGWRSKALKENVVNHESPSEGEQSENFLLESQLKLYPNPTNGDFRIQSQQGKVSAIELYSMQGELLEQRSDLNSSDLELSMRGLSEGSYALRITFKNGHTFYKTIVVY